MKSTFLFVLTTLLLSVSVAAQFQIKLKRKDRKRDIEFVTTDGTIILRLSDSTPLHRDNFLRLVKSHFYDSLLFHRVIQYFMIQCGDPTSRNAASGKELGDSSPPYTLPPEFRVTLFHKRGVLAAARESDDVNPQKLSSSSQFYIVQGKKYYGCRIRFSRNKKTEKKDPGLPTGSLQNVGRISSSRSELYDFWRSCKRHGNG